MLDQIQKQLYNYTTHNDFIQDIVSKGINYVNNNSLGLMILKYDKNNSNCNLNDNFTRYCRGLIIEKESRRIVCCPPEKSSNFTNLIPLIMEHDNKWENVTIENFIDGTMINVFYYDGKWNIATRSRIGANCRWLGKKTFSEMFEEASNRFDFNCLDSNCIKAS